jgi:hypothetical protein
VQDVDVVLQADEGETGAGLVVMLQRNGQAVEEGEYRKGSQIDKSRRQEKRRPPG